MDKNELLELLGSEGVPENIIEAFAIVKREDFIPKNLRGHAYDNHPLPIGYGQTISQPSTIAFMLEQLDLSDSQKILEIGSGCGYVIALMSNVVRDCEITGIERIKELADSSKRNIHNIDGNHIEIIHGNGYRGLKHNAPFDRIIVSAAASEIPKDIIGQLKDDGIAVIPVKNSIFKFVRRGSSFIKTEFYGFAFVELVK